MLKIFIRSAIILFWIVLICGIIYFPSLELFPKRSDSLNIFTWGDTLDPDVIAKFEKETGIKVQLTYFTSNEELMTKIKATGGEGYDLIVPSDYAVALMVRDGLLKELDHTKLDFYQHLNPQLLNHSFDPGNRYSLPFAWELFGLGYDMDYFADRPIDASWDLIFKPQGYEIVMINDPIQTVLIAAYYLYGPVDTLTKEQLLEVQDLLIRQKKWVEAYADARGNYFLATKNCPVVLATSSYMWRTKKKFPFISFLLPREGTFISVENLAIPRASQKEEIVYQLLNYLYKPASISEHYETFGFFPATLDALDQMDLDPLARGMILTPPEDFKRIHFAKVLASQQEIRDLWIEVKSAPN